MDFQVKNGGFSYTGENFVFKNINFSLNDGQILAVVGKNGAGKTTLLKCICGILKWTEGESILNEKVIKNVSDISEISYVPQLRKSVFSYTVFEMVLMGREKLKRYFEKINDHDIEKTCETLKSMKIYDIKNVKINKLSGGQLQMVYMARALVSEPKLLILDEPESHLDIKNGMYIIEVIKKLAKDKNISCIMNTHFLNNAFEISDYTLMLQNNGYIFGKTADVISKNNILNTFEVKSQIIETDFCNNKKVIFLR